MHQNTFNQQSPFSWRVKRVWVDGPAVAGKPMWEKVKRLGVEQGVLVEMEEERVGYCVSCNRNDSLVAVCCVCGGLMCNSSICAQVVCADEKCQKAVCSSDRELVSAEDEPPRYLCKPHYQAWKQEREALTIALLVGIVILVLLFWFWL